MSPVVALLAVLVQADVPKWQAPPGDESPAIKRLIDTAGQRLEAGASASTILSDLAFDDARPYPRFRALIKVHAPTGKATIVSAKEPGEKLVITFQFGKSGQMVYAYHTDARGAYGKNGVHMQANSGDLKYARLFAYAKTGADGTATFTTIRPAGYPQGELPQHIHFHVEPLQATVGEIWFSDDPRLTPRVRERGQYEALIVKPHKSKEGWTATAKVTLRSAE